MAGRRRSGVTITMVAEAAGVARSSVSRAFTRPDMLSPETVDRVRAVAADLGYAPNHIARALSTGRNSNIGLIVPDVANPFFPPLIRAVQEAADARDYCVFLGNSDEDPAKEDTLLARLSGRVEGVILASPRMSDARIRAHAAVQPLVLINRDLDGLPRVLIDSGLGVRQAVGALADLGHRHFVFVGGPDTSWSNQQRRAAVAQVAAERGLGLSDLPAGVPSFEAGRALVDRLLETGATAVIAFDDITAHGIVSGLRERDIAVPDQMSVVGCDDVLGARISPPLTTVTSPSAEAGRRALQHLMDELRADQPANARDLLATTLTLRATTGAVPGRMAPGRAGARDTLTRAPPTAR